MSWEPVDQVAKNDAGQFVALIGGKWEPVEQAAKSDDGKFMAFRSGTATAPTRQPEAQLPPVSERTDIRGNKVGPNPLEDLMSYYGNVATGASGLMRGGANIISPGLGEKIWPKAVGSEGSVGKVIGQVADPVAMAIGGGVLKAVPYAPVLGNGIIGGLTNLAKNIGAGAAMGGAIGGLSDEGTIGTGAATGAVANVVLPPAVSAATKAAGKVWDVLVGRYGMARAGDIARAAAGGDVNAIRAAAAAAPSDVTATQATAGVKNDVWDALGELAKTNDRTNYFSRLAEKQAQDRAAAVSGLAGAQTQTEARTVAETGKRALNTLTTPMREEELAAANIAGRLKGPLENEAERLGSAASSKVADVRRMEAARLAAERAAQNTVPVEGMPRVSGRYSYAGDTLEPLAERLGTQAASDSLILGEGSRFAQRQADSLAAHGLRPIDGKAVVGGIDGLLNNPSIGTNPNTSKALRAVSSQIDEWAQKNGGVIDAEALYGIRKNLNSTIEGFLGTGDPKAIKAAAASVAAKVRPMIDYAIEQAGGKGWKNYLTTFERGMQEINKGKMAASALGMLEKQPAKFESLVAGNEPKAVEKIFGAGRYDIEQEIGRKGMRVLEKVAGELARDRSIQEGAKRAGQPLNAIIEEGGLDFILPNWIDRNISITNRVLRSLESKLNKSTIDALYAGMRSGKSAAALLDAVPTAEKLTILKGLLPYMEAGTVSAQGK